MMRTHRNLIVAAVVAVGLVAVTGIVLAQSRPERANCPGKIICPLTGETICRDKCPTIDPNRPDCPGRVVCPLTGKLVCKDRCPLQENGAVDGLSKSDLPSCCAKKDQQQSG